MMKKKSFNTSQIVFFVMMFIIATIGAWLVWFNTPFRMGMYADSVVYIMGARNILGGNGYTYFSGTDVYKLITIWPPLYSYILAGIGLTGLDIIRATRLLNIVLMGIDLLMFAGLIYYQTRSKLLSFLAGLLFLFSVPLFLRYTWALTEPLFFTLLLVSIILYYGFLRTQHIGWLVTLGLGTALMYLTRYAGIFLMIVWLLSILLVPTPRNRIRNAAFYLVGLLPAVMIYSVHNYLLGGTLHARSLYLQSIPGAKEKFVNALSVIEGWFSVTSTAWPYHILSLILLSLLFMVCLALVVYCGLKLLRHASDLGERPSAEAILFPLSAAIPIYIATVLLSGFFYDIWLSVDDRMLSPLWFFGLYLLLLVADAFLHRGLKSRILSYVGLFVLLLFCVIKFQNTSNVLRADGQGFFSDGWRNRISIEYVRQTEHELIYSDEPMAIYILTGKIAYQIPFITIDKNTSYQENYQEYEFMRDRLLAEDGILVLFDTHCGDLSDEGIRVLSRGLHIIERIGGACIYAPLP
jgi:hypothetical protein